MSFLFPSVHIQELGSVSCLILGIEIYFIFLVFFNLNLFNFGEKHLNFDYANVLNLANVAKILFSSLLSQIWIPGENLHI